ncbi:winged helix-turn-helix domain-containing protein [Vibrio alfacsensis]|uniref:winged helix-turn-helix domain-containing protein n=1 Tax=Vibrio alfacsensis TaxID=1074311 RepID=UPI001BF122D3|nr:winged helix-turn-helix domain-containing protein [Vibrio alfacsensis]BCN25764.1 transcriptional regulator [Vibrio alfacsensis]
MQCDKPILVGKFHWDVKSRFLYRTNSDINDIDKNAVTLTPKQHRLLLSLYNASPNILQRHEIINFVWESKPTCPESLPQLINRTRLALEDNNKEILVNEPGVGYSLNFTLPEEEEEVEDRTTFENSAQPKVIISVEAKPVDLKAKLILPVLIVLTMCHLGSAIEASYYTHQFLGAFSATPYPHAKKIDAHNISIVIDNNECHYTKNTQLLKCQ